MLATLSRPPAEQLTDDRFRLFIALHVARQNAATATIESYLREARAFRVYLAARDLDLRELTPTVIREWVGRLVADRYSPTTIATKLSAVRRLLDAAVDAGFLALNPAIGIQGPRDRRVTGAAAARTLTLVEIRTLLGTVAAEGAKGDRDRALLALLVGHGLRGVEIERVDLRDLDLGQRQLLVRGKNRDRIVYLRADVAARLALVLAHRRHDGAAPADPLFVAFGHAVCNGRGRRLQRRGLRFIVDHAFARAGLRPSDQSKTAARLAGLAVPTTHGLRATNITRALEAGAPIQDVAQDVGHVDTRTTMRYLDQIRRRENNSALRLAVEF